MDIVRTIIHMGRNKLTAPVGVDKSAGFPALGGHPPGAKFRSLDINSWV
ncbi:MAG: hypothetical protein K8H74_03195 [Notoacmeibacter sp.]|nr:hypothetical protein [Notoacmeibacter sp.]